MIGSEKKAVGNLKCSNNICKYYYEEYNIDFSQLHFQLFATKLELIESLEENSVIFCLYKHDVTL